MKHRFAAMFTLAIAMGGCASQQLSPPPGWYLMQPPMRHGTPNRNAQLADWQSIAFFERARQCDAAREQGLRAYGGYEQVSSAAPMNPVQRSQSLAASSRCVFAGDPRINWFHIQWK